MALPNDGRGPPDINMANSQTEIILGVPEPHRREAAELYDAAFGAKFSPAIRSEEDRLNVLAQSFHLSNAFAAIQGKRLVGLAGFQTADDSLTSGMNWEVLSSALGFLKASRAALVMSLYERGARPQQLLMDGIAVDPSRRGQGIGTRLLDELTAYAKRKGYHEIRLDVIDTNPGARRLYERNGFTAQDTQHFGYLRWLLGFGASTTMVRSLSDPSD